MPEQNFTPPMERDTFDPAEGSAGIYTDSATNQFMGEMIERYQRSKGWVSKRWRAPDFKDWKPSWEKD